MGKEKGGRWETRIGRGRGRRGGKGKTPPRLARTEMRARKCSNTARDARPRCNTKEKLSKAGDFRHKGTTLKAR
ncbi:hypothetical protein RJT34_05931 [Clitoria ternatea]|uniref:Uncharacterized protein n=1 Tax=Clitoria ternatea TaxID=43366 RepID=A0AAN9K3J6_CLITE